MCFGFFFLFSLSFIVSFLIDIGFFFCLPLFYLLLVFLLCISIFFDNLSSFYLFLLSSFMLIDVLLSYLLVQRLDNFSSLCDSLCLSSSTTATTATSASGAVYPPTYSGWLTRRTGTCCPQHVTSVWWWAENLVLARQRAPSSS